MKKVDLTKGKVISVLGSLALPIMGSSLLQFTYNIVDMLWVGNLGSDAVASIGSSSFYIGLGYAINALVIIGTSIKVSHAIGEKSEHRIKKYVNAGVTLNLIIGIVYGLILILFGKRFIGFLQLNNSLVERDSYIYLAVNAPILFFTFYNLLYAKIVGSFGNNKVALNISTIGIVINIILDPIFIYVLKLGVMGAALATLIANILMFFLYRRKSMSFLKFDFKEGIEYRKIIEIIILGLPMSIQRILFTLINIMLARIIGSFGSEAIAAQKIGLQIESVTYMVIGGLHGAIASFTGQNFGAKKYKRILEGYSVALKLGIIYSIFMALVFMFLNVPLIRLFIQEEGTIRIAADYLKIVAFSQIFSTMETVSNGLFTGLGKPKIPSVISIVFTAMRIPMAMIFTKLLGLNGVWLSICVSSILKGTVAFTMYRVSVRKEYRNVEED